MRKKAQEKKRALSPSSPSSSKTSFSSNVTTEDLVPYQETGDRSFYDTGGHDQYQIPISKGNKIGENQEQEENGYSMDDIWKEITLPEVNNIEPLLLYDGYSEEGCNFANCPVMASPTWEYCSDSLWHMDDEQDIKMFFPTSTDLIAD